MLINKSLSSFKDNTLFVMLTLIIEYIDIVCYMTQMCSGNTSGRVLNTELYAQRLQKLIYLLLLMIRLFHEDFSSIIRAMGNLHETAC